MTKKDHLLAVKKFEDFDLMSNMEIVGDIPSRIFFKSSKKQDEVFALFEKIPQGKAAKIKFTDGQIWKRYNQSLRFYAGHYEGGKALIISARKNEEGYFIFIKKKSFEVPNEKSLEE